MIRVRICTSRCRCQSSCRRSRFSGLGTQIRGKLFSSISRASSRSVFCLRTRLVLITAGSPIHNSKPSSASNRSNQRECPVASIPTRTLTPRCFQFSVELLGFTIAVIQFPFSALSRFLIHKSDFLNARVIIYSYNDHVWLLSPEPLVVNQPQCTRVEGASIVMKSSEVLLLR